MGLRALTKHKVSRHTVSRENKKRISGNSADRALREIKTARGALAKQLTALTRWAVRA